MTGKVISLKPKRFGFIKQDGNGPEVYFHVQDFSGFWNDLVTDFEKGDSISVEFDVKKTEQGPRAVRVRRIGHPNEGHVIDND